jgi:hypothetical protein
VGDIVSVGRGLWGLSAWYPNPGRFAKKRDSDKGDSEPNTIKPGGAVASPSAQPAGPFGLTTTEVATSSGSGLFGDGASVTPSNLDDEVPF